ncbi:MAG: hypothetical protein J5960_00435 [Desulfovibrio sp.]|nr:hypothetical protein [Desulfovibrio sp.]
MHETYRIAMDGTTPRLVPCPADHVPDCASGLVPGHAIVRRLGDPALLHCAVFRREGGAGGCFAAYDAEGLLFTVLAETNLAWGAGLGLLGRMVTYARYGADIFEEQDDADD